MISNDPLTTYAGKIAYITNILTDSEIELGMLEVDTLNEFCWRFRAVKTYQVTIDRKDYEAKTILDFSFNFRENSENRIKFADIRTNIDLGRTMNVNYKVKYRHHLGYFTMTELSSVIENIYPRFERIVAILENARTTQYSGLTFEQDVRVMLLGNDEFEATISDGIFDTKEMCWRKVES